MCFQAHLACGSTLGLRHEPEKTFSGEETRVYSVESDRASFPNKACLTPEPGLGTSVLQPPGTFHHLAHPSSASSCFLGFQQALLHVCSLPSQTPSCASPPWHPSRPPPTSLPPSSQEHVTTLPWWLLVASRRGCQAVVSRRLSSEIVINAYPQALVPREPILNP